jgi:hypothetical protein
VTGGEPVTGCIPRSNRCFWILVLARFPVFCYVVLVHGSVPVLRFQSPNTKLRVPILVTEILIFSSYFFTVK